MARAALSGPRSGSRCTASAEVFAGDTATFRAPLWEVVGPHRHGIYSITHPGMPGIFLPAGVPDRWLVGFHGRRRPLARADRGAHPDRRGRCRPPVEVGRTGSFSAAAQMAERYRAGPAFLAGDAAHRVTPRGGTGLNVAFQDGCDLGWKLAWVINGWAAEPLLDTYEAERRPVAEHNAKRSADPMGTIRAPEQELHVDLGGRIAHVWERGRVSTLDLLGPGLTLFTARPRVEPLARRGAAGRAASRSRCSASRRRRPGHWASPATAARCWRGPTARPRACSRRPRPPPCTRPWRRSQARSGASAFEGADAARRVAGRARSRVQTRRGA